MRRMMIVVLATACVAGAVGLAKAEQMSVKTMPPSVVKTVPQAGDIEVDPSTKEIRVTFSKDMMTKNMWSVCRVSDEAFPESNGKIHYLDDKRTCVIPVRLESGKTYILWLNTEKHDSFRDTENNPSVPYLLVFETKKPGDTEGGN